MNQTQVLKLLQILLLALLVPTIVCYLVDMSLLNRLNIFDAQNASLLSGFRLENPHKKILSLVKVFLSCSIFFVIIFLIKTKYKSLMPALNFFKKRITKIVYVLGIAAFLTYLSIFSTLIFNDKYVLNDFVRVSQRTILSSDGKSVDDIKVLNQHFIYPPIIDRRSDQDASTVFSKEELKKFEAKNIVNPSIFDLRGYYFYHHAYSFGPMLQLNLGAPIDGIVMVYGYVAAVTQEKLLSFFGKINFQNYLNLFYFEYLAYFILFTLIAQKVFRDYSITSIGALLCTSSVLLLGIELIKLAPGFNPIRHFFDVFVFYFLYEYFKTRCIKSLFLTIAVSFISIIWSKDFGLYISLSVLLSLIYFYIGTSSFSKGGIKNAALCAVYFLIICILFTYPMPGSNPSSIYFLIGLGAPVLENSELIYWCIVIFALVSLTFLLNLEGEYKYLTVFACFYALCSFSYYVWYPKIHHILGVAPIYILWFLCIINALKNNKFIFNFIVAIITLLFFYSAASYLRSAIVYSRNYQNHVIYDVDINDHKFKSIGDPIYYKNSIDLINKYSINNSEIYIISKYDYLISMLSRKQLNNGYIEIWSNLVSEKEIDKIVNLIEQNKPQYLYLDVDIVSKEKFTKLHMDRSIGILTRMRGNGVSRDITYDDAPMKEIYNRIKNIYYVCDNGLLIDVLCLRK